MSSSVEVNTGEIRADDAALTGAPSEASPAPRTRLTGIWHWMVALVDQGFVSGTRFLATIIVGRVCGPAELGTYSLAFSLLVLGGCFQEAVITTPYAVFGQRLRRRSRATYAGAVARMHIFAALASALILIALGAVAIARHTPELASVAFVLAVTLPCSLIAEFARRFSLAQLDVRAAAWIDGAIAAIQLSLLILLARVKWLDAHVALLAIAIAYVLPAMAWWIVRGRSQMHSASSAAPYWRRNWTLGRWLVASQGMAVIHGYIPAWLLALFVDTHATGRFFAYLNLALLANPLIFTIGNLLIPRAAQARAHGGLAAAQYVVLKVLLCFVSLMAAFALMLTITGHAIVQLIYGELFVGTERLAGLFGLTAIMWAISGTCASGLVAVGRPRWGFVASCVGASVTALSITLLAPIWSVYGATLGNLLGNTTAAAIHTWAFISVSGGLRLRGTAVPKSVTTGS